MRFRTPTFAAAAATAAMATAAIGIALATPAWADSAPVITQQPASQTVVPGGTASFTAVAGGAPDPSVVWQMSTDNGATFKPTSVTSTTLTVSNASPAQNGTEFRALFTNSSGSATSATAVLSVAQGAGNLIVTIEPQSQTVAPGGTATFQAAATGDPPPSVEWEVSTNKGGSWSATGVTAPTLKLVNVPASINGNEYRAVFSNPGGLIATAAATVTVSGAPAPGTPTVTLPAANIGQGYSVTLTATGGKAPYSWSLDPSSSPLPHGLTLTPSGMISGTPGGPPGTTTMTVKVADSSNPPQVATETVSLTVKTPCLAGNSTFVCKAYVALLGRSPAPAEISLWVNALHAGVISPQGVALAITTSPEYRTDLIQSLFKAYLHRNTDAAGVATNIGLLSGGATDEAVQAGILGSQEYFDGRGGSTTSAFVAALYGDLLGRAPSSGEVASWQQQLSQGTNRTQVGAGILNSPEYRGDFVALSFRRLLGRAVDGPGLNAFVSALTGGETDEQAIAALVSSPEFLNRA